MIRLRHCTVQVYSPRDSHRKSFILVIEASWTDGSLDRFKIRVNTILPGIFPSEMTGVSAKPDLSDLIESNPQAAKAVARCPAGRAGAETEIVGPCLFLASAAGGYMNNARITVDGGRLMAAGSNDGVRMEDWTYV
jgi:NAD(P)-dependent dehydrogenase (short-subunit alcohol dehydrogenase family)